MEDEKKRIEEEKKRLFFAMVGDMEAKSKEKEEMESAPWFCERAPSNRLLLPIVAFCVASFCLSAAQFVEGTSLSA